MRNETILTEEEKRFLYLSAKDKLTLQEQLEYAQIKKKEISQTFKKANFHAFTTGCLSAAMLATAFMPSFVLPAALSCTCLGFLVRMEQTYFRKVQAKANYYFNILKVKDDDKNYQRILQQVRTDAFDYSKNMFSRMRSAERFAKQLERIDLDRKHGLAYDLMQEYASLPRFRIELATAAAVALVAGAFLPQMAFLSVGVCMAGLSAFLGVVDAKTIRKNRYEHWLKKEEILKSQIQQKIQQFEKNKTELEAENNLKTVSFQKSLKHRVDSSHQKED